MQIPDEIRKCVVFLCINAEAGWEFQGTAFFVEQCMGATKCLHLVTAKHIIAGIRSKYPDEKIYLRVNLKTGGRDFVDTSYDQWIFHPDTLVDIALLPCVKLPTDMDIDYKPYPLGASINDEVIRNERIGIGDDVFLPGLFTGHTGEKKNIPIIRTGNIAAMPDEQVETRYGMMDAYLIETRSIGGLSGSPVFVHLGNVRFFEVGNQRPSEDGIKEASVMKLRIGTSEPEDEDIEIDFSGKSYLLGVMHGHWDVSESSIDTYIDSKGDRKSVNMGIAIVIPISKVIETVNQPKVKELKDKIIGKRK